MCSNTATIILVDRNSCDQRYACAEHASIMEHPDDIVITMEEMDIDRTALCDFRVMVTFSDDPVIYDGFHVSRTNVTKPITS